jgi:hypothetical protein
MMKRHHSRVYGGEIGSDLEREKRESARVERLIDRIGWKIQASRDPLAPSAIIGYRHMYIRAHQDGGY